ncbi:MAG TPA: hypothetical protein VGK24_01465 [Candidatus Angelobacter sp.]|jgi:hypothetical protein
MKLSKTSHTHAGPSLLALAIVHTLLFAANIIAGALLRHGAIFVNPYGPAESARQFFAANPEALRVAAFFFFSSSIPLGIYTATVVSRLRFLGVRAAGSDIATYGGYAASAAIALSGLSTWILSVPEVAASLPVTRMLHFFSFLSGGTAFAVGFGLLAAGVSVTSLFLRLLPRWLVWFGLFIALAGELSTLSLMLHQTAITIPIVRFGGFIWLIAVGAVLPNTIREEV